MKNISDFLRESKKNYEYEDEDRYVEIINDEPYFSSDKLKAVINSALDDYENGESDGEDIEIYDQEKDEVVWTTADK